MKFLGMFAILALVVGGAIGCAASEKTVHEEDRVVVHYNREAWLLAEQLLPLIGKDPVAAAAALATIAQKYGLPLSGQMVKVWGAPKEPQPPISEEAVQAALASSTKAHETPWWMAALGGAVSAAGVMLTLGKTVARFIPGVGQFVTLAETAFTGIERFMQDRKAAGDGAAVERLATFLQSEQADPRIRALVDKTLHAVKKKLGVDGTENLAASEPPAAAEPAPAS